MYGTLISFGVMLNDKGKVLEYNYPYKPWQKSSGDPIFNVEVKFDAMTSFSRKHSMEIKTSISEWAKM